MKWGGASQKWVEKRCIPYVNEVPGNIFSQGANWQTQMPSLVVDVLFCHACDFLRWLLLSKELFRDEPLWKAKSQPGWLWNVWYGDSIAVSREGNYTPFFFLYMLPAASTSLFEALFSFSMICICLLHVWHFRFISNQDVLSILLLNRQTFLFRYQSFAITRLSCTLKTYLDFNQSGYSIVAMQTHAMQ